MRSKTLHPASILDHLQLLDKGLHSIELKTGDDWGIDEVVRSCLEARAFFFVTKNGGFCVLQPFEEQLRRLHVWLVYSSEGEAIRSYEPEIVRLAREIDAKIISFESPRKGYQKILSHWQRKETHYFREVL